MKILMVASEAVPFAKTGGLADVAGVLPRFLHALGHDVRVVIPRHYIVGVEKYQLRPVGGPLGVPMGIMGELWAGVYEGRLANSDVPIYFIDYENYFGRANLYNEDDGQGYQDNDNRFVFLSRAALQLCKMLDFAPDIVHANDWHTAAVPIFLNTLYRHDPHLGGAASILTIHNIEYQGRYYSGLMDVLGVGWEHFHHLGLEWNTQVNLLKGGIYHATLFNAVSHGYAEEIKTAQFGHGLEGTILDRQDALRGILNGIDYQEWNPVQDPFIAAPYSRDDLSGKALCKADLQREMGLPQRPVPLIGLVARMVHQKGIDLVAEIFHRLMALDIQVVLLGTGEAWAHDFFAQAAQRHPQRFACRLAYDNALAHRIEAGADFFLMPSRFEPCGLNQLFSLAYGTPPIVHAVGGLDDTVENFDEYNLSGTGFKFYDFNPNALFDTIGWAVHTWFNRPDAMHAIIQNGMARRFSWEGSAKEYEALYQEAIQRKFP